MEDNNGFFREITRRSRQQIIPVNYLYIFVLLFFVTFLGGFGIWYTLFNVCKTDYYSAVSFSIFQFCSAMVATSLIDIYTNEKIEHKKSFNIYSLGLLILMAGYFYYSCKNNYLYSMLGSFLCLLITLIIWHLANSDSDKFNEKTFSSEMKDETKEIHGNGW